MSDHPRYPRYTVREPDADEPVAKRVGYETARIAALLLGEGRRPFGIIEHPANRWRIKCVPGARNPIVVRDASRPAWLGQYANLDIAFLAIDNVIRRERGMPDRIDWAGIGMYARELDNAAPTFRAQA